LDQDGNERNIKKRINKHRVLMTQHGGSRENGPQLQAASPENSNKFSQREVKVAP